jgi:phosphate transport system substrate-binding protein
VPETPGVCDILTSFATILADLTGPLHAAHGGLTAIGDSAAVTDKDHAGPSRARTNRGREPRRRQGPALEEDRVFKHLPARWTAVALVAALGFGACSASATTAPGGGGSAAPAASSGGTASSGGVQASADYSSVTPSTTIGKNDKAQVTGAGSTAIYPWLSAVAQFYQQQVAPGVALNYQAIGSGGGITQFTAKTVDFGASDVALTDQQEQTIGVPVLNVPMIHWAVAIAYNLPGVTANLRFSPSTIAGIYLGTITKWNDPAIAADNPGVTLPDMGITVAHRSDGSGTTYNFTAFLSGISSDWKTKVGNDTSVNWPVGAGGKGNAGVTAIVKQTTGGIGYVDLAYALQNNLPVGAVKNAAGNFVKPTLQATTDAVSAAMPNAPADLRFLIVNPPASFPNAYPIGASTWVLLYKDYPASKATEVKAMIDFLWWAIHNGQNYAAQVDYSSMAPALVAKAEAALKSVTVGGQPVLP